MTIDYKHRIYNSIFYEEIVKYSFYIVIGIIVLATIYYLFLRDKKIKNKKSEMNNKTFPPEVIKDKKNDKISFWLMMSPLFLLVLLAIVFVGFLLAAGIGIFANIENFDFIITVFISLYYIGILSFAAILPCFVIGLTLRLRSKKYKKI